jgi:serine/threonine protein kinase
MIGITRIPEPPGVFGQGNHAIYQSLQALAKRVPKGEMSASLEETVSERTKEGTTAGTLPHMAPEQPRGEAVDHRSDKFSFGIVLYEVLAGRTPFRSRIPWIPESGGRRLVSEVRGGDKASFRRIRGACC